MKRMVNTRFFQISKKPCYQFKVQFLEGMLLMIIQTLQKDQTLAKKDLKNPLKVTQKNLDAGKELYTIYCAVCHGDKGDGNGILMQREKILGIPSYAAPGRADYPRWCLSCTDVWIKFYGILCIPNK